jgi:hypothetical protein
MPTSSSWNYSATAADIITAALEDINVLVAGETIDSDDSTMALRTLNMLVKQWSGNADQAQGLKVHTRQRITLFLAENQLQYLVGPGSSDARATTSYGRTTLSAAEALGQTVISITSNADSTTVPGTTVTMTSGDIVGIVLDDGTIHWSTISGTPAATMTIADSLASAAASGNYVYWFTSRAQRFVDIEHANLRDAEMIDTHVEVYTDVGQYESLPQKDGEGDPTAILVEPLRTQTRVTLDFAPQDVTKQLRLTVIYPAEDYDATTDDIAYPQEWFAALEWELAKRLAPKFNKRWTKTHEINWEQATQIARQLNPQSTTVYFQPHADGHA